MQGVSVGKQIGESYANRDDALKAAGAHKGNEVIVQRDDGQFEVHEATLSTAAKDKVLTNAYMTTDLDPNIVAFSVETERHADGSYKYAETTFDLGLANDEVYDGSKVVGTGDAAKYADAEKAIGQINQMDRMKGTTTDDKRCGANNLLATAIRQGPAAVQKIIDSLKDKYPALKDLNVSDSLTPREVGLIADAMYRSAAGKAVDKGLTGPQIADMAKKTGVSDAAAYQKTPQNDLGIDGMKDGETRMFLVRVDEMGGTPAGQGNHWVSITKHGDKFEATDSGREPHQQTFASAASAEQWVKSDLPTKGPNGKATDEAEIVVIPPKK
jgi:hypothetical protein